MKVYIEDNLPKILIEKLQAIFKEKMVDTISEADIVLKYAHDKNLHLSPLDEFNLQISNPSFKKTVFFCWYDWYDPAQSDYFREYFTPDFPYLWDISLFRFIQLPSKEDIIHTTTKKLYDAK